jgi:hypothetical protein
MTSGTVAGWADHVVPRTSHLDELPQDRMVHISIKGRISPPMTGLQALAIVHSTPHVHSLLEHAHYKIVTPGPLVEVTMPSIATWVLAALAAVQAVHATSQGVSSTARCGAQYSLTCKGSSFGNCCSKNGWCGSSSDYCGDGCQSGWGICNSGSSAPPVTVPKISQKGSCAQNGGSTCLGSNFGDCCR